MRVVPRGRVNSAHPRRPVSALPIRILLEDLNGRLDEAALSPDFEALPIEALARRVIADMGLTGGFALSLGEVRATPTREPQPADTG